MQRQTTAQTAAQAITGTLTGNVVLWQGGHGAGREWQALKQVPLHTAPIRFMAALQGLIYCGFSDGRARAYDSRLRLASWAEVCGVACRHALRSVQDEHTIQISSRLCVHHADAERRCRRVCCRASRRTVIQRSIRLLSAGRHRVSGVRLVPEATTGWVWRRLGAEQVPRAWRLQQNLGLR